MMFANGHVKPSSLQLTHQTYRELLGNLAFNPLIHQLLAQTPLLHQLHFQKHLSQELKQVHLQKVSWIPEVERSYKMLLSQNPETH